MVEYEKQQLNSVLVASFFQGEEDGLVVNKTADWYRWGRFEYFFKFEYFIFFYDVPYRKNLQCHTENWMYDDNEEQYCHCKQRNIIASKLWVAIHVFNDNTHEC